MENVSHTLLGAVMVKAGLDRLTPLAMPTSLIAANLPDADALSLFDGQEAYFRYHRGITHSFLGVCILAPLLSLAVLAYDRNVRRTRDPNLPPARFGAILFISVIGLLSHLVLDYTNSYGLRPFLPFSRHWYYGDLAFIVDPWILLILGFALLGAVLRRRAAIAAAGLVALLVYWGMLYGAHQAALTRVKQAKPQARSIAAFPVFADPFSWRCVAESNRDLWFWRENLRAGPSDSKLAIHDRHPIANTALRQIAANPVGKTFLDFARYYRIDEKLTPTRLEVNLDDVRFNLTARFILSKDLQITSAEFLRPNPAAFHFGKF